MPIMKSPTHPDGWKFVGIFAAVTVCFFLLSTSLGWIGVILTGWCFYFFRNPPRVTPVRKGLIVSPADGRVCLIEKRVPPAEFDIGTEERWRVSIFLNVFDVHVNRLPFSGVIEKIIYHPGQFLNASFDKASDLNERQTLIINNDGVKIACIQIAGLIARRIRRDIDVGDTLSIGHVYGLIRFGSRMDVYLPVGVDPLVIIGQRMIAGETILGDIESAEPRREGITQ